MQAGDPKSTKGHHRGLLGFRLMKGSAAGFFFGGIIGLDSRLVGP
jgi:hypothetical protein